MADPDNASNGPGLVRKLPLDGLKPTDFVEGWPLGEITAPPELLTRGLSAEAVENTVDYVRFLRDLVLDYNHFVLEKGTREAIARKVGVSPGRLSSFRRGNDWPQARTVWILRRVVPARPKSAPSSHD